jgi:transglutaminase-like putative cysteine protease
LVPISASQNNLAFGWYNEKNSCIDRPKTRLSPQPVYVKLQALQNGSIVFSEAIPQSFQDHVATINVSVLAVLVSSNAQNITLHSDPIGNLWLAVNYTLKERDYLSTLAWVSSETVKENLTIPESVPFPQSYPQNIRQFLSSGRKLPVNDTGIKEIAKDYLNPQDMIETVRNILYFVNGTQTYNRDKVVQLMTGKVNTTDLLLDFINDPLESLRTNSSFCFERALLATTMLRTVNVPARTFTNADLKTWIEVWLPEIGWVDAEILCNYPYPFFPRPLTYSIPWMVENSSDARFPFSWFPSALMRVSNLTLSSFETSTINEYGTVLSQPVDEGMYATMPDKFSFPIILKSNTVQAALTLNGSEVVFHLSSGEESTCKTLILGETNNIQLENISLSFKPVRQGNIIILYNFAVGTVLVFDSRIIIPLIAIAAAVPLLWLYWKKRRIKT